MDANIRLITLDDLNIPLLVKIPLVTAMFLYTIFTFFIYTKIRALERIVFFPPRSASRRVKTFALYYFFVSLSLFVLALVIV